MSERDAKRFADRLEHDADELERRSDELQDRVKGVGEDWDRKRADPSIPGAPAPEASEDDAQDESSPGPETQPPETDPSAAEAGDEGAASQPSEAGDESD